MMRSWQAVRTTILVSLFTCLLGAPGLAHAAAPKRFGSTDGVASAYLVIRGKKVDTFLLSFQLHCRSTDSGGEFDVTFTAGAFESSASVRSNRLQGTFIFDDGSGRTAQIDASSVLRGRAPILNLYIQPFSSDAALEVCDVQRLSIPLRKLR